MIKPKKANPPPRGRDPRDYKIRIINFKLKMCQRNLDNVVTKIKRGELVDMASLNSG